MKIPWSRFVLLALTTIATTNCPVRCEDFARHNRYKFQGNTWRMEQAQIPRMQQPQHAVREGKVSTPGSLTINDAWLLQPQPAPPMVRRSVNAAAFGQPRLDATMPSRAVPASAAIPRALRPSSTRQAKAPLHIANNPQKVIHVRRTRHVGGKLLADCLSPKQVASYAPGQGYTYAPKSFSASETRTWTNVNGTVLPAKQRKEK